MLKINWSSIRFQRNNNTYRMLTGICRLVLAGMLLYAKTDEETYPDNDYKMSGNKTGVHTLDLSVEFKEIRRQLDGIAERYFVQ